MGNPREEEATKKHVVEDEDDELDWDRAQSVVERTKAKREWTRRTEAVIRVSSGVVFLPLLVTDIADSAWAVYRNCWN